LLFLFVAWSAIAQSNPPVLTPSKNDQPPDASPQDKQQKAAPDQRGTEKTPLFLKGEITTRKSQADAVNEAKQQEEKSASDNALVRGTEELAFQTERLAGYTFYLFFATAILMFFTGLLWRANRMLIEDGRATAARQAVDTQESLRIANESAIAARRTAETMENSATRELRAYISLEITARPYPPSDPNRYAISLVVTNRGKTWARNLTLRKAIIKQDLSDKRDPFDVMEKPAIASLPLGPGQFLDVQFGDIAYSDVPEIAKRKIRRSYVAVARYEDTVSPTAIIHQTQLSQSLNGDNEGGISFSYLSTHNCADEDCPQDNPPPSQT